MTDPTLLQLALAEVFIRLRAIDAAEATVLAPLVGKVADAYSVAERDAKLSNFLLNPAHEDPLGRVAWQLGLSGAELCSLALAAAVEQSMDAGRAVARLQVPLGNSRPTLGLLAGLYGHGGESTLERLAQGTAAEVGLLVLGGSDSPWPERLVAVPDVVLAALRGVDCRSAEAQVDLDTGTRVPLAPSQVLQAEHHARGLSQGGTLVVRSGSEAEGRAVAGVIAQALQRRPLFLRGASLPLGLVPWLLLRDLVPVFLRRPGPGEQIELPDLPHYDGPVLVVAGLEGSIHRAGGTVLGWTVPVPTPDERQALWTDALGDEALAAELGQTHRHGAARIADLARLVRQHARGTQGTIEKATIRQVALAAEAGGLSALAQALPAEVPDSALVVPPEISRDLNTLKLRAKHREHLVDQLGPSSITRYQSGVRALFVGPSGTGKTLAAGWLATQLGLPLYRVDLASVMSKYIGETEKNLAQMLAEAEQAEIVLLFDEADALFGKRTDVKQANDRFANAQTNYLLQRIESYSGIVVLTSNSRTRFDPAFTRRLDLILEFPLPGPSERRDIWLAHLGDRHSLEQAQLNQLAVTCDLAGGNIRNAVLAAAVHAREAGRKIGWADLLRGLSIEYDKLGRQAPTGLRA